MYFGITLLRLYAFLPSLQIDTLRDDGAAENLEMSHWSLDFHDVSGSTASGNVPSGELAKYT